MKGRTTLRGMSRSVRSVTHANSADEFGIIIEDKPILGGGKKRWNFRLYGANLVCPACEAEDRKEG